MKFFQKQDQATGGRPIPPGQHLAKGFPVLTYGETPQVDLQTWEFRVWGLVKPTKFNWSDFMALPQHEFTADFHCVTRWSKLDVKWTGVKVTDLMNLLEVDSLAAHVMEHCYGGYTTNISMTDFVREDNFFAFQVFGEPLTSEHGGPLRLVEKCQVD
jgi:DMSO/TMAO reductase YedYZ molybdopterin-dependent catalytic subunit